MKQAIGVDLTEVKRFEAEVENQRFLTKIFTQNELDYCFSKSSPAQHLAVRFAAKESVVKALSSLKIINPPKLGLKDIEVNRQENGVPLIQIIPGKIQENFEISLSLSHTTELAVASVVVRIL